MNETYLINGWCFYISTPWSLGLTCMQSWLVLNWYMTLDKLTTHEESVFKMGISVMRWLCMLGMSVIFHKEFTATLVQTAFWISSIFILLEIGVLTEVSQTLIWNTFPVWSEEEVESSTSFFNLPLGAKTREIHFFPLGWYYYCSFQSGVLIYIVSTNENDSQAYMST